MSIREITMYSIRCDHAAGTPEHCTIDTQEVNYEYAAWSDVDGAETDWDSSDGQSTAEGKHYCSGHHVPICETCGSAVNLVNDDPEDEGDWYCPQHRVTPGEKAFRDFDPLSPVKPA